MDCSKKLLHRLICRFHFTNRDNQHYYLFDHHTPFEGFLSPFITVTKSDGAQLDYEGAIAGHYHTTKKELVHLQAGTTKSVSVEVSSAYNFNEDGIYTIHYNTPLVYMSENEFASLQESDSVSEARFSSMPLQIFEDVLVENTANFPKTSRQLVLEKELSLKKMYRAPICGIKLIGTISNARFERELRLAHGMLCTGSSGGIHHARSNAVNTNSEIYREWFGTASGAYNVYDKMYEGVQYGTVTYDVTKDSGPCVSRGDVYGYTWKGTSTVYLCDLFFGFPLYCQSNLAYTKEGALVHELSHSFGYTDDLGYGTGNARNLARDDPSKAVRNAENYHFFYCDTNTPQ